MESESGILSESVFFTARKAPLHSHIEKLTGVASSSSSSTKYYSARIHTLMKLKSEGGMSEKDAEIEASKTHWTEMESNRYYTPASSEREESSTSETGGESCPSTSGREESSTSETGGESCGVTGGESCGEGMTDEEWAELSIMNKFEMLQPQKESDFFRIGGKVAGEIIAKGGQATIYEHWNDAERKSIPMVMRVFEAGYSVSELWKQWPVDLLQRNKGPVQVPLIMDWEHCSPEGWEYDIPERIMSNISKATYCELNYILWGRLLDDGRFAFQMFKYWGDVRKLLDVRMQHNGNRYPPFMVKDGSYQEDCIYRIWYLIALGMHQLHSEGTLHRDLKASNVLIESNIYLRSSKEEDRLNPLKLGTKFMCFVADYECLIGVVGTGFWRAPEILVALKNRVLFTIDSVCTPPFTLAADIYSYTMTCYEILTRFIPFEYPLDEGTNIDEVLEGKRPTLPPHLKPWVIELFQRRWHLDPFERPNFGIILTILYSKRPKFLEKGTLLSNNWIFWRM